MPRKTQNKRNRKNKNRSTKVGARTNEQTNWVLKTPRLKAFPDRMITTLRFWEQQSPNWSAESFKFFIYRGTSVFDPRVALGGLSADGFDQYALIYNTYRVLKSRILLKMANSAAGAVPFTLIVVPLNLDPGSPSGVTVISWANQSYASIKIGGLTTPCSISSAMTTSRMYGSEAVNVDDNFSSLVSTNPNNNWFWSIGVYSNVSVTATSPVLLDIVVEYDVQFYDRAVLTDAMARKLRLLREELFSAAVTKGSPPPPVF